MIYKVQFYFGFQGEVLSVGLEIFILVIVVINLIRPAAVYVSLFVDHFASARASLVTKIVKSLFGK